MTDAEVHLTTQPRLDTIVTEYATDARLLRTEHAGVAWIGDEPDSDSGMMGPVYRRRRIDTQVFLPDTHWYDADALEDVQVQVSAALLQVPATSQGTQGLVGALAEPEAQFFEHPEGLTGVGLCLWLRGEIWSNVGLAYRVVLHCAPAAVLRAGSLGDEPSATDDATAAEIGD